MDGKSNRILEKLKMTGRVKTFSRFYALLNQLVGANKEQLVSEFTNGRTTSLREMTKQEYNEMCNKLQGDDSEINEKELKHWRHVVLTSLSAMNIFVQGKDYSAVDNYCMNKRIAGKRFAMLNAAELQALNKKLNAIKLKSKKTKNKKKPEILMPLIMTSVPIMA